MKIICSCGISYQVYDYPPSDVEEGGKQMKERHIMCPCDREIVMRTAPKYEPDYEGTEKTSPLASFEEISRRLGIVPPPGTPQNAPEAAPATPSLILGPEADQPPASAGKGLFLTPDDASTLSTLIGHYGSYYKCSETQKEDQEKFAVLAERAKLGGMFNLQTEEEERMVRMGFLERNITKIWPVGPYDEEGEFNVQQTIRAKTLREKFKNLLGWDK